MTFFLSNDFSFSVFLVKWGFSWLYSSLQLLTLHKPLFSNVKPLSVLEVDTKIAFIRRPIVTFHTMGPEGQRCFFPTPSSSSACVARNRLSPDHTRMIACCMWEGWEDNSHYPRAHPRLIGDFSHNKTWTCCGGIIMSNDVARPWQNAATLLRAARTQEMFLKTFRNTFCVQDTKFVSATNVARVAKRVNNLENMTMSAMLPPQCVLVLPV